MEQWHQVIDPRSTPYTRSIALKSRSSLSNIHLAVWIDKLSSLIITNYFRKRKASTHSSRVPRRSLMSSDEFLTFQSHLRECRCWSWRKCRFSWIVGRHCFNEPSDWFRLPTGIRFWYVSKDGSSERRGLCPCRWDDSGDGYIQHDELADVITAIVRRSCESISFSFSFSLSIF